MLPSRHTLPPQLTYQYSVKEHARPIDHSQGSHGTPGVYFKYDISALKVEVSQDRCGGHSIHRVITLSPLDLVFCSSWFVCAPGLVGSWPPRGSYRGWSRTWSSSTAAPGARRGRMRCKLLSKIGDHLSFSCFDLIRRSGSLVNSPEVTNGQFKNVIYQNPLLAGSS